MLSKSYLRREIDAGRLTPKIQEMFPWDQARESSGSCRIETKLELEKVKIEFTEWYE